MNNISKNRPILLLSLLLSLSFLLNTAAIADTGDKTIFYNLTTDEAWKAGMALGQATKALETGYKVDVFLNVRGVFLAAKSFNTDTSGSSDKSLQDMLKGIMEKGGRVIVCPMCTKKAGFTLDSYIDGVVMGGADVTLKSMTADNTVVISF